MANGLSKAGCAPEDSLTNRNWTFFVTLALLLDFRTTSHVVYRSDTAGTLKPGTLALHFLKGLSSLRYRRKPGSLVMTPMYHDKSSCFHQQMSGEYYTNLIHTTFHIHPKPSTPFLRCLKLHMVWQAHHFYGKCHCYHTSKHLVDKSPKSMKTS